MPNSKRNTESDWCMWYDVKPDSVEQTRSGFFGDRLLQICTMDALPKHQEHEKHMKAPEDLPQHANMYVFRKYIRPMWEQLPEGGAWTLKIRRGDDRVKAAWARLVGDLLKDGLGSENVAGIVLSSRPREFSINVWLVSGETSVMRFEILERLRELWQLTEGDLIQFKDFRESMVDDSSRVNAVVYRVRAEPDAHQIGQKGLLDPPKQKYVLPDPVSGSFTFQY